MSATTTVPAARQKIADAVEVIDWTMRTAEKATDVGDDDLDQQTQVERNFEVRIAENGGAEGDIQGPDYYDWFQAFDVVVFYPLEYDRATLSDLLQFDGHDIKVAVEDSGNWIADATLHQSAETVPRQAASRDPDPPFEIKGYALVMRVVSHILCTR